VRSRLASLALVAGSALLATGARADVPAADPASVEVAAANVDRQLDRISREMASADGEVDRLRTRAELARRRMVARGRAYFRAVHAGLLPLGAGFDALMEHSSKAERLRRAIERDLGEIREADDARVALLERRQKLLARKVPLEMQQKAMAQARAALAEAEDRRRSFERAFAGSTAPDYLAIYGSSGASLGLGTAPAAEASTTPGFRALKGRLPFPLAGRAEIRTVHRAGAGGAGLEMRAPIGTPARSVASGRVAFADEYGSYGRVVIVDHGEHYFTVCGNLGAIEARVGDDVGTGTRIGTVGEGSGGRGLLYFEIRHGADTLEPSPWLGI
jgi:septal ring factor EnvC (AmiA/AmiB activator)